MRYILYGVARAKIGTKNRSRLLGKKIRKSIDCTARIW